MSTKCLHVFLILILASCSNDPPCDCPSESRIVLIPIYNVTLKMTFLHPVTKRTKIHTDECKRLTVKPKDSNIKNNNNKRAS